MDRRTDIRIVNPRPKKTKMGGVCRLISAEQIVHHVQFPAVF